MAMDERESAIAGEEEEKMVEEEEEEVGDLEPFFYDEAAAAAEKRRLREEQEAAEKAAHARRWAAHQAVLDRISERDPETGKMYYTRYHDQDLSEFDIDEVSPLPPMRFTARVYSPGEARLYILNMVNVLAIRIVPSDADDVPFPIAVYGSVIARDDLDRKCIPLFARSRDDPQLIASKDDSLILTGPHRGMVLIDALYFEINLKLKGDQFGSAEEDKQICKAVWRMNGVFLETNFLSQTCLLRNLYPLQLMYAFVSNAVEATVSVKVLQGHFYGKITACTSMVKDNILLHDSNLMPGGGGVMAADHGNDQFVRLLRPVMAVYLHETLKVTILAQVDGTKYNRRTMHFKPAVNGEGEAQITCGVNSLLVKVCWSLMN
uniref:DUF6598 domain-containing protein n=1 Tax=Oryza meridionalis TaxID=40149 RepID=A0A0E0FE86_9ORYZ